MCNECHQFPHVSGCPDDSGFYPQRICFTCHVCGEPIYEDDLYMEFDGIQICKPCVEEHESVAIYNGGDEYDERSFP